jgi:saccharopine dehydrogenase-like NADP-dependent oxidoreductase
MKKRILVFGAGRSAYYTIQYLLAHAAEKNWSITIADSYPDNLEAYKKESPEAVTVVANVSDTISRQDIVKVQDIIISLLPATFHILVAQDCVAYGVHLITPSYLTPELELLHLEASAKKLIILNEIGLDPGIDHMSSMRIIHRLKSEGAIINSYKSNCGGLVSKKNCDNPWDYKITWNPYNIVRAGHDGALYLVDKEFHYVPYHRLFNEISLIEADGEKFDCYMNRNSLHYISLYGLQEASTFYRGTLRYEGFCKKWNTIINLGLTTDSVIMDTGDDMPWADYINSFLPENMKNDLNAFANTDPEIINAIEWLLIDAGNLAMKTATPAENLQKLLEHRWKLNPGDKDRVVMIHEIGYEKEGKKYLLKSWLDLEGEDDRRTAMAKTVGLPLALAAELIADEKIKTYGVILPTIKEVYEPLLARLEQVGIGFKETVTEQ